MDKIQKGDALSYITVSVTGVDEAAAYAQTDSVLKCLDAGYRIISAVGDGTAVHYILHKAQEPSDV